MSLGSAVLKRFEDTGRAAADLPLVAWAAKYCCLYQGQQALDEILRNFPARTVGQLLRGIVFPLGRRFRDPNDALGHKVASPSVTRARLTEGLHISEDPQDATGRLESCKRYWPLRRSSASSARPAPCSQPWWTTRVGWMFW